MSPSYSFTLRKNYSLFDFAFTPFNETLSCFTFSPNKNNQKYHNFMRYRKLLRSRDLFSSKAAKLISRFPLSVKRIKVVIA